MALIHRITRLFHADMHSVLDRLEEPESQLRQAIREMDDIIHKHNNRLKFENQELKRLLEQQTELQRLLDKIAPELDLCFETGNEKLARTLIRRRLETEQMLQIITRKQGKFKSSIDETAQALHEETNRLLSIRQKLELLTEGPSVHDGERTVTSDSFQISDDDIEIALLRERQIRNYK